MLLERGADDLFLGFLQRLGGLDGLLLHQLGGADLDVLGADEFRLGIDDRLLDAALQLADVATPTAAFQ